LIQNEYETVIIIRPDLDDTATYGIVEKLEQVVTGAGGHLLIRDDWGKRKLQYPIQRHLKGHYVLLSHLAPPSLVTELERRIRIEDSIIRFLTVKLADAVDVPVRLEQVAEQRRLRAEQEQRRRDAGEPEDHHHRPDDDDDDMHHDDHDE
jgi:small subunit ribosomal protein S6